MKTHEPIRSAWTGLFAVVLAALVVAGCGGLPERKSPRPSSGRAPVVAPDGINLVGVCRQKEIDGFQEDASIRVRDGRVENLSWQMKIGRKGSCRFNGNDFRQTKFKPTVELKAKDGSGCRLLMWADPRRITLAHNRCTKFCTAGVYGKAWPVMFDPGTGGCADNNR